MKGRINGSMNIKETPGGKDGLKSSLPATNPSPITNGISETLVTRMKVARLLKFIVVGGGLYLIVFILWLDNDSTKNTEQEPTNEFGEFRRELPPVGPPRGEDGKPYQVDKVRLSGLQQEEYKQGYEVFGYNTYVSDRILPNRTLKDIRAKKCDIFERLGHVEDLPKMSVAMVVKDVPRSVLMRCVYSIAERTPPSTLINIMILDDNSRLSETVDALRKLEKMPKVLVTRLENDMKLMEAKLLTVVMMQPPAMRGVIFLVDPHVEVMHGWAVPVLHFLRDHKRALAVPTVDIIDKDTFEYLPVSNDTEPESLTAFNWFFDQIMLKIPEGGLKDGRDMPFLPYREPTMVGIMAFWYEYIYELLSIYSSEYKTESVTNIDISFRSWLCGDGIYHIPCSRVGHLYPDKSVAKHEQAYYKDKAEDSYRLARSWTGDYMKHHCDRFDKDHCAEMEKRLRQTRKQTNGDSDEGDCKSFDWYMKNIASLVYTPTDVVNCGQLVNEGYGHELCLDHSPFEPEGLVQVKPCLEPLLPGSQYFMLTEDFHLRQDNGCVTYEKNVVKKKPCKEDDEGQRWVYSQDANTINHKGTSKCLGVGSGDILRLIHCMSEFTQKWKFRSIR